MLLIQWAHLESHGFPEQAHTGVDSNAYLGVAHQHQ